MVHGLLELALRQEGLGDLELRQPVREGGGVLVALLEELFDELVLRGRLDLRQQQRLIELRKEERGEKRLRTGTSTIQSWRVRFSLP